MAERNKRRAPVYRSVSFKNLGSWGTNRSEEQPDKCDDSEAAYGSPPSEPSHVRAPRKVSKISATTTAATAEPKKASSAPLSSISPSIRQLTERFSSRRGSERTHRARPGDGAAVPRGNRTLPRSLSHYQDGGAGYIPEKSFLDKIQKFHSGTDSVSGSDSEKKSEKRTFPTDNSGKRDSFCSSNHPKTSKLNNDIDVTIREPKSNKSTHFNEFTPLNPDKWPSVTKIRQLFDERQVNATQQLKINDNLKDSDKNDPDNEQLLDKSNKLSPFSSNNEDTTLSWPEASLVEGHIIKGTLCETMDFHSRIYQQPYLLLDEEASFSNDKVRNNVHRSRGSIGSCSQGSQKSNSSPFSSEAEAASKTPSLIELTPDPHPDLQTSATTSRSSSSSRDASSCGSFLQEPIARERRVRQGVGLPRDSLHSSHSSSTAEASPSFSPLCAPAPDKAITFSSTVTPSSAHVRVDPTRSSCWRFSSGDEEEGRSRKKRDLSGPSHSLIGYLSHSKNVQWRTKGIGRSSGSEEENSLGPSGREAIRRRSLRKKKCFCGHDDDDHDGESEDSDSDSPMTMEHLDRHRQATARGEFVLRLSRSHSAREAAVHSNRAKVQQQWERISSPAASTSLPGVSRVSKVNIPSFASSPGGSRCSSRYSSTETLKEEDQASCTNRFLNTGGGNTTRNASSSVLSKTYYGNFTMYRSPSFGHGDNFPRTQVRMRPQIMPSVTSSSVARPAPRVDETVTSQQTTGRDKNGISKSNPDITTETMTLLNFLKSDLSELKVRKTNEGEKCGMASQSHVGTSGRRLSLKDLTATLRRAKSFTYSGKPSTAVRCYLSGGTTKRSSSEQQLDSDRENNAGRVSVSEREVESDGGDFRLGRGQKILDYGYDDDDEEVMPAPLQERYVQEARQVIQDICQMNTKVDEDDINIIKTVEEKTKGASMERETETDYGADFKTSKENDKHEQERENEEREKSERDEQSMQLEKINSRDTDYQEKVKTQNRETARALQKGDSEESVFCDRSVDELSGHESSLTDEGIVTEPEIGPSNPSERVFLGSGGVNLGSCIARDVLGQPVTIWKQSALHKEEGHTKESEEMMENDTGSSNHLNEVSIPHSSCLEESDDAIISDLDAIRTTNEATDAGSIGGLEAPATPSATRRRRKFSPSVNINTSSEVSNGTTDSMAADVNVESTVYRSLSDPMPHRSSCVAEEDIFSSVDSNLLGSLSVRVGPPEPPVMPTLAECKGSVASDLSVYSDGGLRYDDVVGDYSGVIRSIVAEPGAMDRLMTDDHNNGKAPKKKSFSDPSRRSDAALLSHNDCQFKGQASSTEPINELDQTGPMPPSSSEPILSKQIEKAWEEEEQHKQEAATQSHDCHHGNSDIGIKKARSESDNPDCEDDVIDQSTQRKTEETRRFNFDLKLAEALSPRIVRRSPRKRPNRLAQFFSHEDPLEPPELEEQEGHNNAFELTPPLLASKPKTRPKHVRHASEPATFIPISPPPRPQPLSGQAPSPALRKTPVDETPSLEDATQKYILDVTDCPGPHPHQTRDGAEDSVSSPSTICSSPVTGAVSQTGLDHGPSLPAPQKTKPRVDMRKHVMMTLLDTERSYVESLRTLIQGYMRPLKQPDGGSIVDPLLVDEMFYQIPEILEHHEDFLGQVDGCVNQWHDRQTVGHILIQSFSKETLANMYSAYIDNFLNAKDAVRVAKEAKPAFHKFLEQNMRENKEKQALGDLMIKPVQRIPRYELLVKDLLKHTPEDHPDHSFLLDAQRDIKRLAEKINKGRRSAEEAEREARVIQEIEAHIEGVEHILNPQRKFLRQEMVMEAKTVGGKKDRSLFLFSDLIICTTLKRKSGSLRRSSMSLYSAASVIDTSSKYKFLWKLPLEDVEVVKSSTQTTNKENIQKTIGRLDEDLSTLGQISKLSETLNCPHQPLDEVIKELMASLHRELSEKQSLAFSMTFLPTKLEFTTVSAESSFVFEFTSPDARSNFEQAFEEAKKKLAMNKDQWDPEFLKAIPIMKTRSGMQFSCASPSHTCPESGCEVWVCNSDGYVGQVCLLNIKDEPTVEACIAVCSARIICIAAVPGLKGRDRGPEATAAPIAPNHTQQQLHISISHSSLEMSEHPTGPGAELVPFDSDDTDDEDSPSPSSTLQSQASHSTISSSYGNEDAPCSKDLATETTSSEEEQEFSATSSYSAPGMLTVSGGNRANTESPMDGRAMRRSSRGSFTRASLEDLLSIDPEAYQSSVWLGTEDGCIHVYQSSDNIRNRKNSMKMQHGASILCILYLDNKVFVSLANGEVIVYQREAGSFWDPQSSQTLVLGTPSSPITKMVPVGGKLWCGSQNKILIINSTKLVQEHCFQVGTDSSRCVTCMVAYGQGVWLALQGSAHVKLYHAQTWESLTEVDVAPAVHKMLAGADAIIRQHKAACLRITALLACKDLLWIGTSAGVVLTLATPTVSSGTGACAMKSPPVPMGSAHGHTGHVRFLTSIELPEGLGMNFPSPVLDTTGKQSQCGSTVDGSLQRRDSARRRTSAHLLPKTDHLVISGGDGYEDFRLNNSGETVGRDDSTNHLLLWRV
uniref:rho guanine nucleotide exchange factor 17-like isoform X2 n=1 Tax=Doryrhamphus excisus TaxID=161450 RepID=UPI0025ADDD2F|nr:rho guanine nucleotide exchange factor 17-like isoform X2 [Doryrhamphus excisus]